jgi:hypothetical protein
MIVSLLGLALARSSPTVDSHRDIRVIDHCAERIKRANG